MSAKCFIGTSGWFYEHWQERFYPKELAKKDLLNFYVKYFDTVELNSSFYHLPKEETVKNWYKRAPSGFIFAPKASRLITHYQKLINIKESLGLFLKRIKALKEKLGPILYQLPPSFKKDTKVLEKFVKILPRGLRHTIEFRHTSWFEKEVFDILRNNNIAYCIISMPNFPVKLETTADFSYIRLHGAGGKYSSCYTNKQLRDWSKNIKNFLKEKLDIYVYFNNDANAYAVKNALQLKRFLK